MSKNNDLTFAQKTIAKGVLAIQAKSQQHFPNDPEAAQSYARQLMKAISETSTELSLYPDRAAMNAAARKDGIGDYSYAQYIGTQKR